MVNVVLGYGSTGKIVLKQAEELTEQGYEVKIAYSRDPIPDNAKKYAVKIGSKIDTYFHALYTRLTDKHGLASKKTTKSFLKWADEYNPDMLWIHNIHGYYINYEMLFNWIKSRPEMKVKWTLHDCWAYTGHCAYYSYAKCNRWINENCSSCKRCRTYPKSIKSSSEENYIRKKKAFTGVKNLTIITPSKWLKNEVSKSFLKEYEIEVVNNKIDKRVFKPTKSSFKNDHNLTDKKVILGVANIWEERKGIDDYIKLSQIISDDWVIVLVGKNDYKLPDNIISIDRTNSKEELAAIYSMADVYVNASHEETFGLTTIEALACGTPVIVYNETAIPEVVSDTCGIVVNPGVENIKDNLDRALEITSKDCVASVEKYT